MKLTEDIIAAAKPKTKPYKLHDTGGLFMLVSLTGARLWRFKYYLNQKERGLALGSYPEISLAEARSMRDRARKEVALGIDPSEARKRKRAADAVLVMERQNRLDELRVAAHGAIASIESVLHDRLAFIQRVSTEHSEGPEPDLRTLTITVVTRIPQKTDSE